MHLVVIFKINNNTRSIVDPNKQKPVKNLSSLKSTRNSTINNLLKPTPFRFIIITTTTH